MNKNVVFMTAVKVPGMEDRSIPYNYGISSFKKWCDKNDCELVVLDELIHPHDVMKINYHRYYAFDILDNSGIEYDQILVTDADCIVHPECPNFFELTDRKYTVTHADGCYDWVCRSLENYSKHIFDGKTFPLWNYFNAGFQVVNKSHRYLWDELINFYFNNKDAIQTMQETFHVGTDQPIINFIVNLSKEDVKLLPYQYCMVDLWRKEILTDDLTFTKVMPGIYQFNAIPDNSGADKTLYWMKKTYEHFYGRLEDE
tara:strand:+ start:702 stop:1472 length:771 start_codon:yes stop_codon:yes gene_type:complete